MLLLLMQRSDVVEGWRDGYGVVEFFSGVTPHGLCARQEFEFLYRIEV